ncbi:hypothetical protein P8452_36215 [Trifolium repens]|nr:hypothetical protein P8452_36215 [Trifolium repens]
MTSLRALFPALYSKSLQQDDAISAMGFWNNDSWSWTAVLTDSQTETTADLLSLLQQIWPNRDNSDRRRWLPNSAGFFSVKSAYLQL